VAAEADVLITVLPGPGEVHDVMAGRGGVPAVLPVDMTSISPEVGRVLFHASDDRGIDVPEARAGKLQPSWAATLPGRTSPPVA
jgi:3-hydroxyisobutyrate dehydrogenase-like beta-hydroxyacid dehydrogenase